MSCACFTELDDVFPLYIKPQLRAGTVADCILEKKKNSTADFKAMLESKQ